MLRRLIALMFVLFIALPVSAEWVEVLLKDGRTFSGEVLEDTSSKIRIRTKMAGIDTEMTFGANEVRNIDRKKSNAPAAGPSAAVPNPPSAPEKKTRETGGYAVVPLKGTIGEEITAQFLKEAVERAKKEGAEAVIFHIDSGGGLVRELSDIRDYLDSVANMKVAFFVDQDAMSAAALMCLSSRNFYMGKGGRFGAAVGWYVNETGKVEVDAKFNAAFASEWRGRAEKIGRPGILVDAMVLLEKEVYADQSKSPWTLAPTLPPADPKTGKASGDWKEIDGKDTILSVTADEAVRIGAVDGELDDANSVPEKLSLERPERIAFDGAKMWSFHEDECKRDLDVARQALAVIDVKFDALKKSKNKKEVLQKLGVMESQVKKVVSLYRMKTHVRTFCIKNGITLEKMDDFLKAVPQIRQELK